MQAAKGAEAWWRLRPKALHQSVLLQDKWLQQVTQHQPRTGHGLENVWPGQVFLSVDSRQVRHLLAPRPMFFVIERVLGLECVPRTLKSSLAEDLDARKIISVYMPPAI